jgi:hypothetical protein
MVRGVRGLKTANNRAQVPAGIAGGHLTDG